MYIYVAQHYRELYRLEHVNERIRPHGNLFCLATFPYLSDDARDQLRFFREVTGIAVKASKSSEGNYVDLADFICMKSEEKNIRSL